MYQYVVIDDLISADEADGYMDLIDDLVYEKEGCKCSKHELQTILSMPKIAQKFWHKVKKDLFDANLDVVYRNGKTYQCVGLADYVTVSRHIKPIGIHIDADMKSKLNGIDYKNLVCLYKLALYLHGMNDPYNPKAGGTTLYDDRKREVTTIIPKTGRALIFDIRDFHSGSKISRGKTKYLIGFRLLYRKL